MKRVAKLFVVYFPVMLVFLQVIGNLLYFVDSKAYYASAFYLNLFLGTNFLFAFFLLAFTFMFRFCAVSRWAAGAECIFALLYLVIQQDSAYNIAVQIAVGVLALIATFWHYSKKFPLCRVSLFTGFVASIVKKGDCKKGLEDWDRNVKSILLKQHHKQHERNLR
jgi:signal transduction histidine kinase